jgi:hypothetical protein
LRSILVTKAMQRTETVDVDGLRKQLSKVDSQLATARRNMALAGSDELRVEYESVVLELRQERDRLDASIHNAQKPRARTQDDLEQRITKAVDALCRLREKLTAAPVVKQRELLAMCIDKVEVLSTRTGGRQTTFHLDGGTVHLRPDMWLTAAEADNLSGSSRRRCCMSVRPRHRAIPATGNVRPKNARPSPSRHCRGGQSAPSSGPSARRAN